MLAGLGQGGEQCRVVDGVVARVLAEGCGGLQRTEFDLDLRPQHGLVAVIAVDEEREPAIGEAPDDLEEFRVGLQARLRGSLDGHGRRPIEVFAIRAVRARRCRGGAREGEYEARQGKGDKQVHGRSPMA